MEPIMTISGWLERRKKGGDELVAFCDAQVAQPMEPMYVIM